ncbi:serine hydrolase domain-containing protein [candidate division KSB1 bacterium]
MTIKTFFRFSILLLSMSVFMFCSKNSTGNKETEKTFFQKLQTELDNALISVNGVGVSAAVIMPDGEIWLGASGMSDPEQAEEITTDMLFDVGGVRESFSAAQILKFEEEGILSIEDPISNWLPEFQYIDNSITVRQILEHTSGIYDMSENPINPFKSFPNLDLTRVWMPDEYLSLLISEPSFQPGTSWQYSCTNVHILRMIVDEITSDGRVQDLRNRFFTPLGLNNTFIEYFETIPPQYRLAHGWHSGSDIYSYPRTAVATSLQQSTLTTAEDAAKWIYALFNGQVINQTSLDKMTDFKFPSPSDPEFGMGVQRAEFGGVELWGDWGWQFGFTTLIAYSPDHDFCMAILCNFNESGIHDIFGMLLELIIDEVL